MPHENCDLIDSVGPDLVSFSSSHIIIKSDSPEDNAISAASMWCKDSSKYKIMLLLIFLITRRVIHLEV